MEHIGSESAENLLQELVAIPSPSGQEAAAARHLTDWMAAQGYEKAGVDAVGNAVGIRGDGERVLLLLGHIDTFRGQPPVRRDGRRLYGRGAVDAKGALCAFAVAGATVSVPAGWRLVVVGAVEEEAASSRGARHIAQQWRPAACLIGEPSGWERITLGYKGRLLLDWRWRGPLGHSAGRQVRGLEEALAYWGKIRERADRHAAADGAQYKRTHFERLDATLQALRNEDDGLYETVRMTIGLRLPLQMDPAALARECLDYLGEGATLHPSAGEWAVEGERDSTLSRALRGSIRAAGGQPRFVRKTGTADWNVVARHWSCPILAYGPGDAALDHTPEEHLDLAEYLRAIAVLRGALPRVMAS
ncbi:MAG: [LysW]-lysine hydrolase [Anaerolineaceae bacterium]|nr:[LysW]-lysine hydrolase [Anaerolineaceae bacterium]